MNITVGIDIGGTFIKGALLDPKGRILSKDEFPTGSKRTPKDVIKRTTEAVSLLLQKSTIAKKNVLGVGIGCPGQISSQKGIVYNSPNMKNWENVPLQSEISKALSLPVEIFNDANAAAWGEFWLGSGKNASTFILCTLGTGIGGGIIIDKKLYLGPDECAGELGHITVVNNGPKCGCGNHGCIETIASASSIVKRAEKKIRRGARTTLTKEYEKNSLTAKSIYIAAKNGDAFSKELLNDTGKYLGIAAAGIINTLNPDIIAYGGGLSKAGKFLFSSLKEEAKRRSIKIAFKRVKIIKASLGNDAGFIGAAGLMLEKRKK
jgi:glucokinase